MLVLECKITNKLVIFEVTKALLFDVLGKKSLSKA